MNLKSPNKIIQAEPTVRADSEVRGREMEGGPEARSRDGPTLLLRPARPVRALDFTRLVSGNMEALFYRVSVKDN